MNRISLNELHEEILEKLTQKDFIRRINVSEEKIQSLVLNKIFITKLSILISKENITCEDVKELSLEILNSLSKDLPKDWLEYVYEYILYKSFPDSVTRKLNPKYENAVIVYLEVLRTVLLHVEKHQGPENNSFNSYIMNGSDEFDKIEDFQKFKRVYSNNYIYELIKLNFELTNSSLYYRIKSVWGLSMQIAKKLKMADVDVKLWLVCSLAIGYFIGNYALKQADYKSNYYTKEWFEKFGLSNIGNVAIYNSISCIHVGHLPIESLILIYSNLRVEVKNSGKVLLNSLEQIDKSVFDCFDEYKEQCILYIEKLKDFERYLSTNGVDIKFSNSIINNTKKDVAFLEGNEIIDYYKNNSLDNNIKVMNLLSDEITFNYMIEMAKGTKIWKDIIIYLNIFDEYTLY
ncbi:MAG TPA: hypothetical protein DC000_10390, partial [Clostridiales bacterium]|nr:hypothetical protein [Clostridiales bacterium]